MWWESVPKDLLSTLRQLVRELNIKGDDEVPSFGWILWMWQSLPLDSSSCRWLHHISEGQREATLS